MDFEVVPNRLTLIVLIRRVNLSENLIDAVCKARIVLRRLLRLIKKNIPLVDDALLVFTAHELLQILGCKRLTIGRIHTQLIAIESPIAARERAHMILHLHTGEQKALSQPLVELAGCYIGVEPVGSVSRLHDASALRPLTIVCDVT